MPNQKSSGKNRDLYIEALGVKLKDNKIVYDEWIDPGTDGYRGLHICGYYVHHENGQFVFLNEETDEELHRTISDKPIAEATEYLMACLKNEG